jgi:hypothetical protein
MDLLRAALQASPANFVVFRDEVQSSAMGTERDQARATGVDDRFEPTGVPLNLSEKKPSLECSENQPVP